MEVGERQPHNESLVGRQQRHFCSRAGRCEVCGGQLGFVFGLQGFGWWDERHKRQCMPVVNTEARPSLATPAPAPVPAAATVTPTTPIQRAGTWRNAAGFESLGWVNALFAQIWPHVDAAARRILREQVAPQVKESLPSLLQSSFKIIKFELGNTPPVLGPITYQEFRGGARLKIEVNFDSSVDIMLHIGANAGVRSLKFSGSLVLRLGPFLDEAPVVGGVMVYFLNRPRLELDFTGLGNIADAPMIAGIVRRTIDNILAGALVLPNAICVPLGKEEQGVDPIALKQPMPLGVVRVTVVDAKGLLAKDVSLLRAATSDPYVVVKLSGEEWRSSTVQKNCNPTWLATDFRDFTMADSEQQFTFEVFDEDRYTNDDLIGVSKPVTLEEALSKDELVIPLHQRQDGTGPADAGTLRVKFAWFELVTSTDNTTGSMVAVRLTELQLPTSCPVEVLLAAEFGGIERSTRPLKTKQVQSPVEHAVDEKIRGIVQRCNDSGIDRPTIAKLTALDAPRVDAILGGDDEPSEAAGEPRSLHVGSLLYIPVAHQPSNSAGEVTLSVRDKKGKTLGKVSILPQTLAHGFGPSSLPLAKPEGGDSGFQICALAALHGLQPGDDASPQEFEIGTPTRRRPGIR